ncbi:HD domain-containing phosphohydrolase [Anaerosacchariphilus polymeriproducens]|uniref:Stage 0 sporulation protein A homolog n=1 Tax=Anaerosacchariphilus polymeriproducens TaxID=1812858 RepID=A0A371ATV7_9FIRM|nr:HD domain-containing phosphohydrolase [Anaerosacchariphilus polymeriproducens]RDU23001.1 HD domain-containing protein [Anaerosacchariphilus polymeriproducens]
MTTYKILIVDENIKDMDELEQIVYGLGQNYNFFKTDKFEEALTLLENKKIDILITNYELNQKLGTELISRCKKKSVSTVRILMGNYNNLNVINEEVISGNIFHFLIKPWDTHYVAEIIQQAVIYRENLFISNYNSEEEDKFLKYKQDVLDLQNDVISALMMVIEVSNRELYIHSVQVSRIASMIAEKMKLPKKGIREVKIAGLLHDIGKIAIQDEILNKPGKLNNFEFDVMKEHSYKGSLVLSGLKDMNKISTIVCQHHEKMDGSGYPYGLLGDDILIEARILSVADTFDALVSDRIYHRGISAEMALEILGWNEEGYDQKVIEALKKCYKY